MTQKEISEKLKKYRDLENSSVTLKSSGEKGTVISVQAKNKNIYELYLEVHVKIGREIWRVNIDAFLSDFNF